MSEAVKMPHIDLVYDHCDSAVIGELVNFLKSKYRNISITVNSSQEETDNDEELVDAFESDFWKSATVGNLLAGYRLKHQLTQKQLAARAGIVPCDHQRIRNRKETVVSPFRNQTCGRIGGGLRLFS